MGTFIDPPAGRTMFSRQMRLPYRLCVGALLVDRAGLVCLERKPPECALGTSADCWQMPESGITRDEQPREAGLRLLEGLGVGEVQVLAEAPGWFSYELPADMLGMALDGRYCGQKHKWIAARMPGEERNPPKTRRWVPATDVALLAPVLKREVYEDVVATFAPFLPAARQSTQDKPAQKAAVLPWFVSLFG